MYDGFLFNINAFIGRGPYEEAQFPSVESLVEHMDYLGVGRSLAWSLKARDLNPDYGNRLLMDEIKSSGTGGRLVPGFIVTPACFYEYGTLEFLRENLDRNRVKALRITPHMSRFSIREIERVLAELDRFKPAVFWDCAHEEEDLRVRDFDYLAGVFPGIPFVVTQKMWGGFSAVLDIMWRRPNISVDISWLHMKDTIELLVENFGAERVLFGLGYKSHYGASIASLAHADITDEQRGLIGHKNVERILGLPPQQKKLSSAPEILSRKPMWNAVRSGLPVENTEIIDGHGHTPPHTRGWVLRQKDMKEGMADLMLQMDRLGVNKMVLSIESALFGENVEGNLEGEKIFSARKDRFSGYLVFNPLYAEEMVPQLDDFFARGFFIGFKLLPSYWKSPLYEPGYRPVWEYADRRRLPILMHTWDDRHNSPAFLEDIAPRYPGAAFILGHSGGGTRGRLEAEALAKACPNVYLEFCGSFTTPRPFEKSMGIVGSNRVIFGSDTHAHGLAWELGRYLSLPLPDSELLPGLAGNFRRILIPGDLSI